MLDRVQGINVRGYEEFFFLGGGGCEYIKATHIQVPRKRAYAGIHSPSIYI